MATTMAVRELSDAELIASSRKGDSNSYGELYRRHVEAARAAARALTRSRPDADDVASEAFARVLRALQGGGGPEVSFRPYLVTAVRNVFYDRVRRTKEEPTDELEDDVNASLLDAADNQQEGAFAAAAFATLPERWQLVLWHTEVEGKSVAEVAPLLGLAPNAVAALAYRAREGLRQAYLQAHLREQHTAECRECATNLGAFVRDGLSARDRRRVEAHLDNCDRCTALVAELTEANTTLRAALIPILVGVPAAAYLSGLGGGGIVGAFVRMPKGKQALVATAGTSSAAGLVAAVVLVAAALGGPADRAAVVIDTVVSTAPSGTNGNDPSPPTTPPDTTTPPVTTTPTDTTTVVVPPTLPGTTPTDPVQSGPATTAPATNPATTAPATNPATTKPTTTVAATTTVPVPPALTAAGVQLTAAVAGHEVRVSYSVANTGSAAATGLRLDLPLPAGATLVEAEGSGWSCSGSLSCARTSLPAGQSASVELTLRLPLTSPSTVTFQPNIAAPAGAITTLTPLTIAVAAGTDMLVAETARGSVQAIGNSVVTCADSSPQCVEARQFQGPQQNHSSHMMQYVNTAGGTFNSSSAQLVLDGRVAHAYLVWGGDVSQSSMTAIDAAARGSVRFTTPGGTTTVNAARLVDNSGSTYFGYADVTSLVSANGTYAVADLQTSLGTGSFGGWSLVVVTHNDSLPERLLVVNAPMRVLSGGAPGGFVVPTVAPLSSAGARLVVVGFEGDPAGGLTADTLTLSGFSLSNAFTGSIPGARNPSTPNNFGTDVIVSQPSGLTAPNLSFSATSMNDRVMLAVVGVALDL